jgi:hypothetical protein
MWFQLFSESKFSCLIIHHSKEIAAEPLRKRLVPTRFGLWITSLPRSSGFQTIGSDIDCDSKRFAPRPVFRRSDPVISASRRRACGRPSVAVDHRLPVRDPHRTGGLNPQTGHGNDYRPPASPIFRGRSEVILEWRSADYHRAAAARAKGLLAEATTRWQRREGRPQAHCQLR